MKKTTKASAAAVQRRNGAANAKEKNIVNEERIETLSTAQDAEKEVEEMSNKILRKRRPIQSLKILFLHG